MINITIGDKVFNAENKIKILDLIDNDHKKTYMCAKVDNRLRELTYELNKDATVELLDTTTPDAVKVYETSLRYLIAMAFHNIYPNYKVHISYSVSRSILVSVSKPNNIVADEKLINNIKNELDRLVSLDLPFTRVTLSKEDTAKLYKKFHEDDKLKILDDRPEKDCHFTECDGYLNYMYGYVVPSTGYINKYKLFSYDGKIIVQYPRYEAKGEIPEFVDEQTLSRVLKSAHKWEVLCGGDLVSKINDHVRNDTDVDFINMCETKHNDMLAELGDKIVSDIDNIKLVCIAGPSSSGKTTFSNRLRIELMSRGIKPLRISLDMYYKPREQCPIDENGNYDFESIDALNLELFNKNMLGLINGEEVTLPIFDFKTGTVLEGQTVKIDDKTPIIIEGIHALNDKLSYAIPKYQKFKIYIAPLFQINLDNHNPISYTDIRLLRRIVRDHSTRNTSAEDTLTMWSNVRKGEFKWIYPNQEGCNYVYNSGLIYELCVLKKYALPLLKEIDSSSPCYVTANRLIKFLKYFKEIDTTYIPCNSLIREFIGGSCFKDV